MKLSVDELVDIALEASTIDSIDFSGLNIDEKTAYRMIATSVLEDYSDLDKEVLLAIITKLVVENFVLNLKLFKDA